MNEITHIIYGPYTDTFARKSSVDRVDQRWACFSLVMGEADKQRTVDFAAEDEAVLLPWLLGLQQTIAFWAEQAGKPVPPSEQWTLPKLHLQKLRLKVSGESDRTGQGPYDVVLSAVLDVAGEKVTHDEATKMIQKNFRRRNVQGKFQTAVQEMMEINGLLEDLTEKEAELKKQQDQTAADIQKGMASQGRSEAPPRQPSDRDMKDPTKMQEYMLQMGEYSARQQLNLAKVEGDVAKNQEVSAKLQELQTEKRKLENMSTKLMFGIQNAKIDTLTPEQAQAVLDIQSSLGVTPRGTIKADVRTVVLKKDTASTRLGIIFHQNTPEELIQDADTTPRAHGGRKELNELPANQIVLPVIKVIDPAGVASKVDLNVGDQVLTVNGEAAISNVSTVSMLRAAVGDVVLVVRPTSISHTPRGSLKATPVSLGGGLRVLPQ